MLAVVAGALANRPDNGGGAAVRLDWVRGLGRLGLEVWFVEQIARDRLTPSGGSPTDVEGSREIAFFERILRAAGLEERSALLDERGNRLAGAAADLLAEVAAEAALLVNLGGHLSLPSLLPRFRRRVYVDLDPGYTQLWHAAGLDAARLEGHHHHFTVGLNVGTPRCALPTGGLRWRPLPPPVVLEDWPADGGAAERFTTVASWRGPFGRLEHEGRAFGQKAHALRELLPLPARVPAPLELALDIHPGDHRDLDALRAHGWRIADPRRVAGDPESYRRYLAGSAAELSVAQGVYVETRSGWISDRTARYLACGRPALVQDTGYADNFRVGTGLVPFRDLDEAAAGAEAILADYEEHSRGARELAEERFDSDRVLADMLDDVGVAA